MRKLFFLPLTILLIVLIINDSTTGLKCYKCISRNHGNASCESASDVVLDYDCRARGEFRGERVPAQYCVFMATKRGITIESTKLFD